MVFPVFSEHSVSLIRSGAQSVLFIIDEEDKWKNGFFIELWYKIPKTPGSYEFARGRVVELKDMIWYPDKGIMTVIHSDGTWKHLKSEEEQFKFIKHCGYSSMQHFKDKKTKQFQTKVLCLAPKWGAGKLILPDITRFTING